MPDVERGQFAEVKPYLWQTDTAIALNSWCYTENNQFKNPTDLICDLVDIVSKNGRMLLNVGPKSDGTISKEDQYIFDLVRESQIAAINAIRPGVLAREVEQAHRDVFLKAGLEDYALKGLGHGIGLEIHECPRIVIGNETRLVPGMVFTVEPGLYFPDRCGVRTEDDVLVTESGCENLSHTPHEIHIG